MIIKGLIRLGLSEPTRKNRLDRHRFESVFMFKSSFKLKRFKIFEFKNRLQNRLKSTHFERFPSLVTADRIGITFLVVKGPPLTLQTINNTVSSQYNEFWYNEFGR